MKDISPESRKLLHKISNRLYVINEGQEDGQWVVSAKRPGEWQLHLARADTKDDAIAALASLLGVSDQ